VKRWLVIGIGHPQRGDDAAGLVVSARLRALGCDALTVLDCGGDTAQLMDMWRASPRVIVVDAVCSGGRPGHLHTFEVNGEPLPAGFRHASTHTLGVAEAVEMARVMGCLPPRLVVVGVEASSFELGAPMNTATSRGCARAVRLVMNLTG